MSDCSIVVIDTQSLLDWLVFKNPYCVEWGSHLQGIGWKWIFTSAMKSEFDAVLAKGFGQAWPIEHEAVEAAWHGHGHRVETPAPLGAGTRLICRDRDDQKFIDLAIAARAHALVSRDRALLKLASRAWTRHGVRICRPDAWLPMPQA